MQQRLVGDIASFFASELQSFVDDAHEVEDLISLLKYTTLQKFKQLVSDHTKSTNPASLRAMYFKSLPVDRILSMDVMQEVLSFIPMQRDLKAVSNGFKQLLRKNEKLSERLRPVQIASLYFVLE